MQYLIELRGKHYVPGNWCVLAQNVNVCLLAAGASEQADVSETEASGLPWGITRCIHLKRIK